MGPTSEQDMIAQALQEYARRKQISAQPQAPQPGSVRSYIGNMQAQDPASMGAVKPDMTGVRDPSLLDGLRNYAQQMGLMAVPNTAPRPANFLEEGFMYGRTNDGLEKSARAAGGMAMNNQRIMAANADREQARGNQARMNMVTGSEADIMPLLKPLEPDVMPVMQNPQMVNAAPQAPRAAYSQQYQGDPVARMRLARR